jgi:Zn-dependent M28 family amino/carboxypeptidase
MSNPIEQSAKLEDKTAQNKTGEEASRLLSNEALGSPSNKNSAMSAEDLASARAAVTQRFKSIEVPADAELDSKQWHCHPPKKENAPGEYVKPVVERTPADSRVAAALDKINANDIKQKIAEISGAADVTINGKTERIESRSSYGTGYQDALQYYKEKYEKDGYKVVIDDYTKSGHTFHNLRAIKVGNTKPDEIVMYGAHIDSTAGEPWGNNEAQAPGADDDGSGSAALSEIAHAIKDLPLDRTVVFSLFSGEEQGLYGSRAMAESYKNGKQGKIVGVFQMDMVGYAPDARTLESHDTSSDAKMHAMTDMLAEAQQKYNINLKVYGAHNDELNNRSDHYSFMRNGIPAILLSEPYDTAPRENPNYHSTNDTIDTVNTSFVADVSKVAAAAGVELAGLEPAKPVVKSSFVPAMPLAAQVKW